MMGARSADGIPVLDPLDYDAPKDFVRAGMVERTKRHEMKQVILARVQPERLRRSAPPPSSDTEREGRDLYPRDICAATSHTRDGLGVGTCC